MSITDIKTFPGFERLYRLNDPSGEEAFHAGFDIPEDKKYADLMKAEWVPQKPLIAEWFLGASDPSDVIPGGAVEIIMISNRVRKLLEAAKLTGWSTYPLVIHNKVGKICEGYAGLSFTGRCGPIDEERGQLLDPDPKFPRYRGIYFDESTWDGSDFFCPTDSTVYRFATGAVRRVFEHNRIVGLEFTPLTEATRYRLLDRE